MNKDRQITVDIIPSKSYAHRAYICDFLAELTADKSSESDSCAGSSEPQGNGIICDLDSNDIRATKACLAALRTYKGPGAPAELECGESGSTLRFILPLAGVLGREVTIKTRGRLSERPMGPFEDELISHGMSISHLPGGIIQASGHLRPGVFRLPGSISSQFITGLMLTLPYLKGDSRILLTSELQSSGYVDMTIDVLKEYGIRITASGIDEAGSGDGVRPYDIAGSQKYHRDAPYIVEGDWSQAAFWLAAGAIGETPVKVRGLNQDSVQGDRRIADVLRSFGARIERTEDLITAYPSELHGITVDVSEIPDLAPVIACAGAAASGVTRIVNAGRLRLKESDRIKSIIECLTDVGIFAEEGEDEIVIHGFGECNTADCGEHYKAGCAAGASYRPAGGTAETAGDHRIVMMAAVLSLITSGKVTITGSGAVSKSYPSFFDEMERAGLMSNIELQE